jgi:hypothetical protein
LESTRATHLEVEQGGYMLQFLNLFLGDALVGIIVDGTDVYTADSQHKQAGTT